MYGAWSTGRARQNGGVLREVATTGQEEQDVRKPMPEIYIQKGLLGSQHKKKCAQHCNKKSLLFFPLFFGARVANKTNLLGLSRNRGIFWFCLLQYLGFIIHVQEGAHQRRVAASTSHITSLITHHTSHITHHTSHITHHTSHITHHTSHITHHTSHITHHTSHITHHTSHITHHTSHITHHTSHITHHTSHITHHTSHITHHITSHHIILSLQVFFSCVLTHTEGGARQAPR